MPYGETQSETWQEDFTLIPRHFEFMFLYSETEGSHLSDSFVRKGCFLCSLETWGMIILIRNNQDASCWDTLSDVCVLPQDMRCATRPSGQSGLVPRTHVELHTCRPLFSKGAHPLHFPQSLLAFLPLAFLLTICLYFLIIFPLICCCDVLHFWL